MKLFYRLFLERYTDNVIQFGWVGVDHATNNLIYTKAILKIKNLK